MEEADGEKSKSKSLIIVISSLDSFTNGGIQERLLSYSRTLMEVLVNSNLEGFKFQVI